MIAMKDMPDKAFDLAIVDPPYGVKMDEGFGGFGRPIARRQYRGGWDSMRPPDNYFTELLRVSGRCLIFGGNFFADVLPQGKHWITWDKLNTMPSFGDCELIWTNSKRNSVKKFTYEWNGLLGKEKQARIHPTQKPVALYKWLLTNYAKPGQTILDTHLGSGSIAIACHDLGFNLTGYEIDKEYFEAAKERLKRHQKQERLFVEEPKRIETARLPLLETVREA
jgi:site-specific DNA-methyltransferase (adenine-specific)